MLKITHALKTRTRIRSIGTRLELRDIYLRDPGLDKGDIIHTNDFYRYVLG